MKINPLLLSLFCILFSGCGKTNAQHSKVNDKKIMVVYFSHTGNTREMAMQIKDATGADSFEIIPVKAYPTGYRACVEQAEREIKANYKPELVSLPDNIDQYDIIFVGSPCWSGTIAPPVATFLSSLDLSGKTIIPFMTHHDSGMGRSENEIKKLCPDATLLKGLPIVGSKVKNSNPEILKWLREIKIIK